MLGNRSITTIFGALFKRRHYTALWNMARFAVHFPSVLLRYLTKWGTYPYICRVSTPSGVIALTLYSYYDLLTLNEIFFRADYDMSSDDKVVVDIGSNIGISALYFLTRNKSSYCYLFEPDARNRVRLEKNLKDYSGRYQLEPSAVSDEEGSLSFGLDEDSGRYGGLGIKTGKSITVDCLHINSVLKKVLARHPRVDLLKIDTEGAEIKTATAIRPEYLKKIGKIYLECEPERVLFPGLFRQVQRGTVCCLDQINGQRAAN